MSDLFTRTWIRVSTLLDREEGQAVTEYAVVLVIIAAIATALVATNLGTTIVTQVSTELGKIKL
jgi:Flp pilus assembly pilin Flp